jgi:DNA invertase Pin-like site-specific DNA recombinase
MKKQQKFVSYIRVSTQEQGKSGLGIEAQKTSIVEYVTNKGGKIISEFIEVASGRNDKRIGLAQAIEMASNQDAVLIVAKLDRLGRNVSYLFQIRDSIKKLVILDCPDMDTVKFGVFATFAQYERERISTRTKEALNARFQRTGLKNGNKKGCSMGKAQAVAATIKRSNAMLEERNIVASNLIKLELAKGQSLQKIANHLNQVGLKTITGKEYTKSRVQSLIKLFDLEGVSASKDSKESTQK